MSLDHLRDQILSNFIEEKVEVNQRLLIDKILARYSTDFVVYRELMQNSDDAKSSSIQIIFETENNKIEGKIKRILFKNNGFSFRIEDWNRLKTIAEGNPDEQKIGAFGVGFYSLFSLCENPFVSSGGQGMAFYWRGKQLFTKQGPIDDKDEGWTTFLMDMRDPLKLPNVEEFARFLTNSLVFTVNLQEISVYFNNTLSIQLSKKLQEPKLMMISSEFNTFSPQKIFHLTSVDIRNVQLDVKCQIGDASIFFRIASGNLDVKVSDTFSAEMERITKKKPPSETTIQMIFTGFNEHNSSKDHNNNISPIFKDLLQYPEQGKIYIGFTTHQTTGCCSHLAARVIPTMERESIDLANKTLAKYNGEMLCLAGTLCRILYEDELTQITRLYYEMICSATKDNEDAKSIRELVEKRAAHALTHFSFNPSTPNEQVGNMIESQFFDCLKQKLSVLSTNGVLPISDIRIPNLEMEGFIRKVPLVPKIILEQCDSFFKKANKKLKIIEELTIHDVLYELNSRILSEDEMVKLLKWWISLRSKENNKRKILSKGDTPTSYNFVTVETATQFLQLARIGDRPLNTFRYFLNPGIIPPDVDIPIEVLPYTISKNFDNQDLKNCFGWLELPLINWAQFIVNYPDLEADPTFAKTVHQILARNLSNTSKSNKEIIRQLFVQKKCIPTTFGMKLPNEAYFEDVNIIPDLPIIQFQKPSSVKNLMELLGVRKVVELGLIFDRLNGKGDWDHIQLIKYFSSMLNDLKEDEIEILKNKPIWPKVNLTDLEFEKTNSMQYFIAKDLYAPLPIHHEFGLPVISWKGRWSHNSQEGKFLIKLGLQEYPTLEKILELAAPPTDPNIRNKALKYFIDKFEEKYSGNYDSTKVNVAFLPCSDSNIFARPLECFISPECEIMKFQVIRQDLRFLVGQLDVKYHPSREKLLNRLIQDPPQNENDAKKIFEYLSSQVINFTDSDWDIISNSKFIPTKNETQPLTNPCNCFFKISDEMLKDFFSHVDFGETANTFLRRCGVKDRPSPIDYAELLVKSSHKLWSSIGNDIERYLIILREIAVDFIHFRTIARNKPNLITEMKKASILVALKKENCYLASAQDIFINDNQIYQQIFNPLTAPEGFELVEFYKVLGCRSLHKSVYESSTPKGTIRETEESYQLQELIKERASLFYFNYTIYVIKRDENWLKKLIIREVDYIETRYILEGITRIKKNHTSILQDDEMDTCTLYITSESSKLDISNHMTKYIFKKYDWKDIFCLNALLTASLSSLKELGYPVDSILKNSALKHIVDQIIINQKRENYSEFSVANSSSHKSSYSSSYKYNPIFDPSANKESVITFETTQTLRNGLRNALISCYSDSRNINNSKADVKDFTKARVLNDNYNNDNKDMSKDNNESNIDNIQNIQNSINNSEIVNENQMNYLNYCDIIPDHLLCRVGTLQGIELYIPEGLNQSEILPQTRTDSLNRFISILKDFAEIFELSLKDIHIFYDNNANIIASNRNRILFFNFGFYLRLHDEECKNNPTINTMTFWFMIFCHELAHNFIESHDSKHEYYSSLLVEIFMTNFLVMLRKREIAW